MSAALNVYSKLNVARAMVHADGPKPTGKNKHGGWSYYQLQDFMPQALRAFKETGLFGSVSFAGDMAQLAIFDVDKPTDSVLFTVPMSTAALPNCHPVQNLGAVISYLRRYLWTNALELTESDPLDETVGNAASNAHTPRQTTNTAPHQPQPKPLPKVQPIEPEKLRKHLLSCKIEDKDALDSKFNDPDFMARYAVSDKAAVDAVYKEVLIIIGKGEA